MLALFQTIDLVLSIFTWILIGSAIFSWLYAFNVINSSNRFVASLGSFFYNVTEPVLRPIRRFMPDLGGIDISPIVVLVLIFFVRSLLWNTIYPLVA
ncbi:YggT family protein [Rhizobium sp. SL42]|uniref:YggT family protein n=1 Tax=Rhizobium sp. SL42 TaxID=2806346 RepID=UPI001F2453A1|nr:YggT family protein [Rhizobium sp. SL42]UJW75243.1 YggT family protein [Rhizobium sp. SL42]